MATICCEWVEDAIRGAKLVYMTALEVLVVEDAPEYQQIVVEVLRTGGHRVRTAGTIAEAEKVLQSTAPDLVILDVMLPDINGKEVCQRVRSDRTMDDVRIICISGMVEEDKVGELRAAGKSAVVLGLMSMLERELRGDEEPVDEDEDETRRLVWGHELADEPELLPALLQRLRPIRKPRQRKEALHQVRE